MLKTMRASARRLAPTRRARGFAVTAAVAVVTTLLVAPPASAVALPSCGSAGLTVTSLGGPNFYVDTKGQFNSSYTGYRVGNGTGAAVDDLWVSLSDFTGGSLGLASGQSAAQRLGSVEAGRDGSLFWYLTASTLSGTAQNHTVTVHRHNPALPNSVPLCSTTGGFSAVQGTIDAAANKVTGISMTGGTPTLGSRFTVTVTGNTGTIGAGVANDTESFWMSPAVVASWPADAFRLVGTSLTISADGRAAAQTHTDTLRVANLGSAARPYSASYTFQAVGFTPTATHVKPVQQIASGTQVKYTGSYEAEIPAIPPPVNDLSISMSGTPDQLDLGGGKASYAATVTGTAGAELDSFVVTPPPGATAVPGTTTWAGRAAEDPVRRGDELVFPGPFTMPATSAQLAFDLLLDGEGGPQSTALVGAIGASRIGATTTPIDGSNPATATVSVDRRPTAGAVAVYVAPGSAVPVDLSDAISDPDGDPLVVTATGGAQHGTVTMDAGRPVYGAAEGFSGDDSFEYTVSDGRGGTATGTVTVRVAERAAQQITLPAPPSEVSAGDQVTLSGSASSGLPVGYTSLTPEVCTVDDAGVVTALATGDCVVEARQAGDDAFAAAAPVTRTFPVEATPLPEPAPDPTVPAPLEQTVTFQAPDALLAGAHPFRLEPTSTSGLPVSLDVLSGECALDGHLLVATTATVCTLEASQDGDTGFAAAAPQRRVIQVVSPADDRVSMGSASSGERDLLVAALANDPGGLTLVGVGRPSHGEATLHEQRVRYTPAARFRGSDAFTYTVRDASGRTAEAVVRVTVANAAPTLRGARVAQLAGRTLRVPLAAADANGDPLRFAAEVDEPGVKASVVAGRLLLDVAPRVSGRVVVRVTARDGAGGTATAVVRDLVTPPRVARAGRRLTSDGTTVTWRKAPTLGARYEVRADGRVVCRTSATSCDTGRVLGPAVDVRVRVLGHDGTASAQRNARPRGHRQVLVETVYFESAKWTLTPDQRAELARVADRILAMGFTTAQLSGYTDSDGGAAYNLALSRKRTRTVAGLLHSHGGIGSRQAWFGYDDPAAPNTTDRGKSLNRRVEILVSY